MSTKLNVHIRGYDTPIFGNFIITRDKSIGNDTNDMARIRSVYWSVMNNQFVD